MPWRRPTGTVLATFAMAFVTAAVIVMLVVSQALTNRDLRESLDERQAAVDELIGQYADLYAEARSEGVVPDSPAPQDLPTAVPEIRAGRDGADASPLQIADAVQNYCDSRGYCRGPIGPPGATGPVGATGDPGATGDTGATGAKGADGRNGDDGAPGRPPTAEEIAAAVAAYCATGACLGPTGDTGATGEPGPGPTDEQVANSVAAYCANHGCPSEPTPTDPGSPES